jgi:urease accessory protein
MHIERLERGSRIARLCHSGPLRIQRPFHPEGRERPHVYLLHPPGGLVSADRLDIRIGVEEGAAVLVTAPGATKAYRSSGESASQSISLSVASGGCMEWLPHETIAFGGARLGMNLDVQLAVDARYFGWEVLALGRPASGDHFRTGRLDLRQTISLDGRPVLRERALWDEGTLEWRHSPAVQRGCSHSAVVVAWPGSAAVRECASALTVAHGLAAAGGLIDGLFVHRVLAQGLPDLRRHLIALWSALRPQVMGVAPCAPRIWAT